MPRPKTISDEAVLSAARRVFCQQGHAASTRDIAREAKISQAVLFQRFGSKEQLFFAAMMPAAPDIDTLFAPQDGKCGREELDDLAWRLFLFLRQHIPILWQVRHHPSFDASVLQAAHDKVAAKVQAGLATSVEQLARDGVISRSLEPKRVAATVLALIHHVAMHTAASSTASAKRKQRNTLRGMLDVLWTGIAPSSGPTA